MQFKEGLISGALVGMHLKSLFVREREALFRQD